jgi:hypothetical protein
MRIDYWGGGLGWRGFDKGRVGHSKPFKGLDSRYSLFGIEAVKIRLACFAEWGI